MRSLGFLTLIVIFTALFSLPPVSSSDDFSLRTGDVITVLSGESLSDSIEVINEAPFNFTAVVYIDYRVEGLSKDLINFTPRYTVFKNWKSGESQVLPFNVSVSSNVTPGFYRLVLRFRGMAEDGSLHDLILEVPLRVSDNPVVLKSLKLYVLQRPDAPSPDPFNGETLVLKAKVENIGNTPTGFVYWTNVTYVPEGKVVYTATGHSVISPGTVEIENRIPVGWNWRSGVYNVTFTVSSLRGKESFWRVVHVSTGVDYINVSLSRDSVLLGGSVEAYVTVLSERKLTTNLSVAVWAGDSPVLERVIPLSLHPGAQVVEVELPANETGELRFTMNLYHGNVSLASATGIYRVLGYPFIAGVERELNGTTLRLNVKITNPNNVSMKARLLYNLTSNGVLLYSDSKSLLLKPGGTVESLDFKLEWNSTVEYSFMLLGDGKTFDTKTGIVKVPPKPISTGWTFSTNTSSQSSGVNGSPRTYVLIVLAIVVVVILAAGIFMGSREEEGYVSPWERARKPRVRPRPKRKSPLGRFKRPKLPRFIENRELPRRLRRKPIAKARKKK